MPNSKLQAKEIRFVSRPQREPSPENFALTTVDLPDLQPGEVLVRNSFFSVDPYMRGRMNESKSYILPFALGKALDGAAVGQVVQSRHAGFPPSTWVLSFCGWRDYYIAQAAQLRMIDASQAPPSAYLGVLGATGLTAWVGLNDGAGIKENETVFISAAAGAVGSVACQLARLRGCHVIASAGSPTKVAFLKNQLKVDYAFNYRESDPLRQLETAAPDGLHVYFDNTAGPQLEAALGSMRNHGRIVMCGAISNYNAPAPGPKNLHQIIVRRLRLQGLLVADHLHRMPAFLAEMIPLLRAGKVLHQETVLHGIEKAPDAFISLLQPGDTHIGKLVIHV
ncbi:MAG TPA: NADP-dependent oxidoreductase [Chthonomonadales bacterium]|nr:NADP-dependent oxidoreductase [Chthonomonadales bacterium]